MIFKGTPKTITREKEQRKTRWNLDPVSRFSKMRLMMVNACE